MLLGDNLFLNANVCIDLFIPNFTINKKNSTGSLFLKIITIVYIPIEDLENAGTSWFSTQMG